MGDVRMYRKPSTAWRIVADGTLRCYPSTAIVRYQCKLHHPDAAEIAEIRAAIAAGMTVTHAAVRFGIGTHSIFTNSLVRLFS